jgi:long-chain acyl-CoA synthetase
LFKTSGGKYVAPQPIENKLKESTFIEQVMVVGENERFVATLIVPTLEQLKHFCAEKNLASSTLEDMISHPEVQQKYQQIIEETNKNFGHVEQVKQFRLVPAEWSVESGELTPTMKVKRKVVMERWKHLIEDIYKEGTVESVEE